MSTFIEESFLEEAYQLATLRLSESMTKLESNKAEETKGVSQLRAVTNLLKDWKEFSSNPGILQP